MAKFAASLTWPLWQLLLAAFVGQEVTKEELSCLATRKRIDSIDISVEISQQEASRQATIKARLVKSRDKLMRIEEAKVTSSGQIASRQILSLQLPGELFVAVLEPGVLGRPLCTWKSTSKSVIASNAADVTKSFLPIDPLRIGMSVKRYSLLHSGSLDGVVGSLNRVSVSQVAANEEEVLIDYERKSGSKVSLAFVTRDEQKLLKRASIELARGFVATMECEFTKHGPSEIWFPSKLRYTEKLGDETKLNENWKISINRLNDSTINEQVDLSHLKLPEGTVFDGDHPQLAAIPEGNWLVWRGGAMRVEPIESMDRFIEKSQNEHVMPFVDQAIAVDSKVKAGDDATDKVMRWFSMKVVGSLLIGSSIVAMLIFGLLKWGRPA